MFSSPHLIGHRALVLIASCFAAIPAWASDDSERIRTIVDREIRPLMAKHNVPGMSVAVTAEGKAYTFHYGIASVADKTPVNESTLFELGSVSKVFTATLASYAQGVGKLSLNDHPGKYMAELKGHPIDKATVLHLGTYTAGGLPLQFPDEVTPLNMVDYYRRWMPASAPGTQRVYSNPSLGLFGHVTALALKRDFTDAMDNMLLPQLGLQNSFIKVPHKAAAAYAWGYNKDSKPVRMNPGVLAAEGYGIKSTAADMIRFVELNIDPDRLEQPLRGAIEGIQVPYFQVGPMVQGLGWEQYPYPLPLTRLLKGNSDEIIWDPNPAVRSAAPGKPAEATLFNKTGSMNGFGNYVAFVPAKRIGIVLLANKNYPIPARVSVAYAILSQLDKR